MLHYLLFPLHMSWRALSTSSQSRLCFYSLTSPRAAALFPSCVLAFTTAANAANMNCVGRSFLNVGLCIFRMDGS